MVALSGIPAVATYWYNNWGRCEQVFGVRSYPYLISGMRFSMSHQLTFADSEFHAKRRKTRKEIFLTRMDGHR